MADNLCGAKTRAGTPCKRPAMKNGRCNLHGGKSPGRPIIHGRYSVKHRESLHNKVQEFLEDPAPANLMHELAVQRAFLQDFLGKLSGTDKIDIKTTNHVFDMTEAIGRLVERITRMLNQTAVTQVEIAFLQASITTLIVKYIDDPNKRLEFMAELRAAFGSDSADRTKAIAVSAVQPIE